MSEEEKDFTSSERASTNVQAPTVVIGQPVTVSQQVHHLQNQRLWTRYSVLVPSGVYSGDLLGINVGNKNVNVAVPRGLTSGSTFFVLIDEKGNVGIDAYNGYSAQPTVRYSHDMAGFNPQVQIIPRVDKSIAFSWGIFELLIFCLLVSAVSLPVFAQQNITTGCNVRNPYTDSVITNMYYILYKGLCSTESGSSIDGSFCILWKDFDAWAAIDAIIGSNMAREAQSAWPAVQAMIPIAVGFAFVTVILTLSAIRQERSSNGNRNNLLFISLTSTTMIICWLMATSSYSASLASTTMSPLAWQRFFGGMQIIHCTLGLLF